MLIKVEIIKKIHDGKKLIGYEVMDESGKTMKLDKDAVKQAIKDGKVEVTNMTVTSDGRILGSAKPSSQKNKKVEIEYKLIEIYTCGDTVIGALVDQASAVDAGVVNIGDITGLNHGYTFETADVAIGRMATNVYSNMKVDSNGVTSDVARVDFSGIKANLLKLMADNSVTIEPCDIKIDENADNYTIEIWNPISSEHNPTIRRIAMLIITHKMCELGFDVESVNDELIRVYAEEVDADTMRNCVVEAFS